VKLLLGLGLACLALATSAATPIGHDRLQTAEWRLIQQVIGEQLIALKAGDGMKAMTYSVPGVRQQFRTPDRFLRMVREGYSALLDARSSSFLEGAVIDGMVVQPLQLVLPDNTVLVALYTMERQRDGRWQIAGCVIAPSTAQAT
jgi:Domain of unknown function (DUF4864)